MKSIFRGMVVALAAWLLVPCADASESDDETRAVFAHLLKTHADSIVRVSFVIVSAYGGQEQRQESSVTGVIVDAAGLVLVPKLVVDPSFPGMSRMSADQKMSFKLESRDFRVYFAGQDQPFEAEALTTDADQGIAWLRITAANAKLLKPVDLKQRAGADPGTAYYVLERLEERYGNAPIVSWGVIQGSVSVPQQAHVGTGAAGLAFNAEGEVLGYVSVDFDESDSAATTTRQNPRMLLTSAARPCVGHAACEVLLDSE
ncbi:MAG: hypothetical protein IPF83_08355 [Rhodanobacteraceae bacterium]|nr:hypothetical protein [Rhodanobacteraceae bacterium]